jgi:hypothetical protein
MILTKFMKSFEMSWLSEYPNPSCVWECKFLLPF